MKDKYLKVRVSEEELEDLKNVGKAHGTTNMSEIVREALGLYKSIGTNKYNSNDVSVKRDRAFELAFAASNLTHSFDVIEFCENKEGDDKELEAKLLELYSEGFIKNLRMSVLRAIHDEIRFYNEVNEEEKNKLIEILSDMLKVK